MWSAYNIPTNLLQLVTNTSAPSARSIHRSRLTKTLVDSLPFTTQGQIIYWDSALPGFGVRIGATSKVYVAESRVTGRTCRVKIGRHGPYTPESARDVAKELMLLMSRGVNPNEKKREDKIKTVTLRQVSEVSVMCAPPG